jgi:O-antigen ligase
MTLALPQQRWLTVGLLGASLAFGALVAQAPQLAVGVLGLAGVVVLAFAAPVAHLLILIGITAIVPFGIQNQYGVGGGADSAGLLISDVFVLTGLAAAALALLRSPPRRSRLVLAAVALFLAIAMFQFMRAIYIGRTPSIAGAELRVMLGFGVALMAIPILSDAARRRRLFMGLGVIAILLGLWGIAQWTFAIDFAAAEDAGLREGVRFTSSGKGQIQGGLYAFAPAIVIAFAVFISGAVESFRGRIFLLAIIGLNLLGLLFTYERTFWVATIVGLAFVVMRTSGRQRVKAIVATPIVLTVFLTLLATVAPDVLGAARERLLSIGQYSSDDSLRYRVVESEHVIGQIREHPLLGNALGATIFWGRPWEGVKPTTDEYAHNGYLWLAWKLGIPAALLLLAILLAAVIRRPPDGDSLRRGFSVGTSAALLVLLLASVTFPSFSALAITPTMALLLAIALSGRGVRRQPDRAPSRAVGATVSPRPGA